jgi:hypothetical protein
MVTAAAQRHCRQSKRHACCGFTGNGKCLRIGTYGDNCPDEVAYHDGQLRGYADWMPCGDAFWVSMERLPLQVVAQLRCQFGDCIDFVVDLDKILHRLRNTLDNWLNNGPENHIDDLC